MELVILHISGIVKNCNILASEKIANSLYWRILNISGTAKMKSICMARRKIAITFVLTLLKIAFCWHW